jgi:hypothetical protein
MTESVFQTQSSLFATLVRVYLPVWLILWHQTSDDESSQTRDSHAPVTPVRARPLAPQRSPSPVD